VNVGNAASNTATSGTSVTMVVNESFSPTATSTMVCRPLYVHPTINYSAVTPGAGNYEALAISVVETALPTGTNYLIRAMAGSGGTTDKFLVTNAGVMVLIAATAPSATQGAVWTDSTQQALATDQGATSANSLKQMLEGVIFTSTANAVSNTKNTTVSLIGTGVGTLTLPANFLVPGKTYRIKLSGFATTTVTSPATLAFQTTLGGTNIATAAAVAPSTAVTNVFWEAEAVVTCRTASSTGTVIGEGKFVIYNAQTTVNQWGLVAVSQTTVTINTTTSLAIDFTVTQSNATGAQTLTCTNASVEVLN
jgi:hypothetical protein